MIVVDAGDLHSFTRNWGYGAQNSVNCSVFCLYDLKEPSGLSSRG